jgi:peptide deformylase
VIPSLGVVKLPHDLYLNRFPSIIREVARPVAHVDDDVRALVAEMWRVLDDLGTSGGLAAPQVGVPLRLFVIELTEPRHPFSLYPPHPEEERDFRPIRAVVINPAVVWRAGETRLDRESCYSLVGYRGILPRATGLKVESVDERGEPFTWDLGAWPARVFQHEIDHLDGIVYADHRVEPLEAVALTGEEA